MTRYIYHGPPSGVTLKGREVLLFPGAEVELPAEERYTQTLVARGHLAPVQPKAEPKTEKPKKGDK